MNKHQEIIDKYNCKLIESAAGVTIEAVIDGEWKELVLLNNVGVRNSTNKEIQEFASKVNHYVNNL